MTAVVPFLEPALAGLLILAIAVMAYYFLLVAPREDAGGTRSGAERDAFSWGQPHRGPETLRWGDPAGTAVPPSDAPAYEMENFAKETWGRSTG